MENSILKNTNAGRTMEEMVTKDRLEELIDYLADDEGKAEKDSGGDGVKKLKLYLNGKQIQELMDSRPSIFNYAILSDLQDVRRLLGAILKTTFEEDGVRIDINCDELEDILLPKETHEKN
jgi:hypothetical protein